MAHEPAERPLATAPVLLACRIEGTTVQGTLLADARDGTCFVFTDEPLALGPRIALHIVMAGANVRLSGRVVRVESARSFGVEFDS